MRPRFLDRIGIDDRFLIVLSLLFALVIVGGARFWLGAVIAAILYRVAPGLLNSWGVDADLALVFFGAALLHALITAPRGLAGQWLAAFQRRTAKAQP